MWGSLTPLFAKQLYFSWLRNPLPAPQTGWHTGHSLQCSAAGNGTWRWEPEAFREDSFSPQTELILFTLAMSAANAFEFELQIVPGKGSWSRNDGSRGAGHTVLWDVYRGSRVTFPKGTRHDRMSSEVTSIIKQLGCKYLCMLCARGWAGSLAWYRPRNSPARSRRQG